MLPDTDVLIVGAGPAGLASGIWARLKGLECIVVERAGALRGAPGETLHPGAGAILRQLGVEHAVAAVSSIRHAGVMTIWNSRREFVRYSEEGNGPRGYQVLRTDLNAILLERLVELGGDVRMNTRAGAPLLHRGRVEGILTRDGALHSPVTIDASGSGGWIRRFVDTAAEDRSPPLLARYGYARGRLRYPATLHGGSSRWSWTAQVQPDLVQWTAMSLTAQRVLGPPDAVSEMTSIGANRSARVTWRETRRAAGPGFFVTGDAAEP